MELSEILASQRPRNFGRREGTGSSKYVKFQDKTFQIMECEVDVQVTEEVIYEQVFLAGLGTGNKCGGAKKPCALQCGKAHTNGSLFFCNHFRNKEPDERRAIQS